MTNKQSCATIEATKISKTEKLLTLHDKNHKVIQNHKRIDRKRMDYIISYRRTGPVPVWSCEKVPQKYQLMNYMARLRANEPLNFQGDKMECFRCATEHFAHELLDTKTTKEKYKLQIEKMETKVQMLSNKEDELKTLIDTLSSIQNSNA